MAEDILARPVQYLKKVGPRRARYFHKLGLYTLRDLLTHYPRRYEDRSNLKKAYQLKHGEVETVQGRVVAVSETQPRKNLSITKVAFHDGSGIFYGVWFNQPYLKKTFTPGMEVIVTGKVDRRYGVQINVSEYEIVEEDGEVIHTGRVVPIYSTTEGLSQRLLRSVIKNAVEEGADACREFLPSGILATYRLMPLPQALRAVHFPTTLEEAAEARRRLVFEELFLLQLGVQMAGRKIKEEGKGVQHRPDGPLMQRFRQYLPFTLTPAQEKVIAQIFRDMESEKPMNRLLQGDVGSGKTVVAAAALVKTVDSGYQGAMMAPTEILAEQHYLTLQEFFWPLGIKVALLTGSLSRREKENYLRGLKSGEYDIAIGTHALIQDEVEFARLGLVVIDEQHRFGVHQRARLRNKGYNPDVLVMTATPIPRTLALTVYGDLDLSVIDQLPPGRKEVKTYWVTPAQRGKVYKFLRQQLEAGRQAYLVCPLIEESEKLEVEAATRKVKEVEAVFGDFRVGLLHGRMKAEEKEEIMERFRAGEVDILVATTVIEVGVNVPNATVMIIEDADRFGLAQLHQLRGRVGRGEHQSYCIMIADPKTDEGRARMQVMTATSNGFVIAEEDLKIRGPGELMGTRQSGLPDLKIADLIRDAGLLETAKKAAEELLERDPELSAPEHRLLREAVLEKFKDRWDYLHIS